MIKKRLEYIFSECYGGKADHLFFDSFKEFHQHIFENGLPDEFQLNDKDGQTLIKYKNTGALSMVTYDHIVPGSIRFEIINQERIAQQT